MLITDVVMPRLGGVELARSLRSLDAGIHVIYMSGYSRESMGPRDAEQDASTWISKPFSQRELLLEVRKRFDPVAPTAPPK